MFGSLANRNVPNVFATLSVGDRHDLILKQSKRQEAPLIVGFPIVFRRECEPPKDLGCVSKINPMFSQVR
jgi:hypothetical protein